MTDQQCADAADSDVSMEDVPPSARDELFWAGEELVRVKDKFYPKRQAPHPPANSTHSQCIIQKPGPYCQCGCTGFRQTHSAAIVRMLQLCAIARLLLF